MRIEQLQPAPITTFPFLNAGRGAGNFYRDTLPVHVAYVNELPPDTQAIVVTADLQGRETFENAAGQPLRLLGDVLPDLLTQQVLPELNVAPSATGVLLAGDFYTVPALDKRGGTGDVQSVWLAFANQFAWVAGVAGNHDLFYGEHQPPRLRDGMHFLDGDVVSIEGLSIAGLSGIPGNPRRPWRRHEDEFVNEYFELLSRNPDIMLSHEGANGKERKDRGNPRIRELLEQTSEVLAIRGHSHWDTPLAELSNGTQILNVDARVVILLGPDPK